MFRGSVLSTTWLTSLPRFYQAQGSVLCEMPLWCPRTSPCKTFEYCHGSAVQGGERNMCGGAGLRHLFPHTSSGITFVPHFDKNVFPPLRGTAVTNVPPLRAPEVHAAPPHPRCQRSKRTSTVKPQTPQNPQNSSVRDSTVPVVILPADASVS